MGNEEDAEAATVRLEQALERIAALAQRPSVQSAPGQLANAVVANPAESADHSGPVVDTAAVASRIDALIAELRGALAR